MHIIYELLGMFIGVMALVVYLTYRITKGFVCGVKRTVKKRPRKRRA